MLDDMRFFVAQFGRHGPQGDMRWLLAHPGFTVPSGQGPSGGLFPVSSERERKLRLAQCLFAELHVRRLLEHPAQLERYYSAVVWSDRLMRPETFRHNAAVLKAEFSPAAGEEYWWYARTFVLMAYATNRSDLLRGVTPEQLHMRFAEWARWLAAEGSFLRPSRSGWRWELDDGEKERQEGYIPFVRRGELPPLSDVPDVPFKDWEGPPPPSAKMFRRLW